MAMISLECLPAPIPIRTVLVTKKRKHLKKRNENVDAVKDDVEVLDEHSKKRNENVDAVVNDVKVLDGDNKNTIEENSDIKSDEDEE